jgi:RND family efflux transporter MFP subunit
MKIFVSILFIFFFFSNGHAEALFELRPYSRDVTFTGFSRPVTSMTVSSEVNGQCVGVFVDVGDPVPENNMVVQLDNSLTLLDLEKNRIAQDRARRQLAEEKNTLSRYTRLIDNASTAQATFDEAKLQADLYTYSLESLRVEEKYLREILQRHEVHAPPGWLVTKRLIEPGEYAHAGEPLLEIGDFRQSIVPFLLTEQELAVVQKMASFGLHLPDYGFDVNAELHRISPVFDPASRKVEVELRFVADARLPKRGGLRCLLTLSTGRVENQFVVPMAALISRYEAHWLVTPEGERRKVIVLGNLEDGIFAVVTGKGLTAGQRYQETPAKVSSP